MSELQLSSRAAKVADQVEDVARAHLGDADRVRVAVRVNLQGLVAATTGRAIGGVAGMLVGTSKLESSGDDVRDAGFPADAQQALGLTSDAVIVVSRSQLSGKPKEFRNALPIASIAAVHFEKGRMGDKLRFEMVAGARADFVCVKVDPGEVFADAVNASIRAASGSTATDPQENP